VLFSALAGLRETTQAEGNKPNVDIKKHLLLLDTSLDLARAFGMQSSHPQV